MTLKQLREEWAKDSKIDQMNLGEESIRTPALHSKYLNVMTEKRLQLRRTKRDRLTLAATKTRYFKGELSKEELQTHGWPQYLGKPVLKSDMDRVLQSDPDMMKLDDKIEYLTITIEFLESVITFLGKRTWDVKGAIEWAKFTSGSF